MRNVVNYFNKCGVFVIVLSCASLLENTFYLSDLLVQFRYQYLCVFLFLFLFNLFLKKFSFSIAYSIMALINVLSLYPTWSNIHHIEYPDLRIYFANLLSTNKEYSIFYQDISKENPDVIVLQEVNERWRRELIPLSEEYSYNILIPREDNFGMAVFSKLKILEQEIIKGEAQVESILFKIKINGQGTTILSTHPLPPVSPNYWRLRNKQYIEVGKYLNRTQGLKILIGDLNSVPWSSHLNRLSEVTNLIPVNTFHGTWNSSFPSGMRLRLDHALISPELKGRLEVLGDIGSDHLPFVLDIAY